MGRLTARLTSFATVGLDTAVFIYHFEENPAYIPLTQALLALIENGDVKGVTSTITLLEILVKPLALGRQEVARKYEALLVNFPNLAVVDLDRDVIRQAARLRAEYHIRPPDALQAGACLHYGAQAFITNDERLKRLGDELEVVMLDDFIERA
jgi:predicted nucleic acid-binding protein